MNITQHLLKFDTMRDYDNWVNNNSELSSSCVCLIMDQGANGIVLYEGVQIPQ